MAQTNKTGVCGSLTQQPVGLTEPLGYGFRPYTADALHLIE